MRKYEDEREAYKLEGRVSQTRRFLEEQYFHSMRTICNTRIVVLRKCEGSKKNSTAAQTYVTLRCELAFAVMNGGQEPQGKRKKLKWKLSL